MGTSSDLWHLISVYWSLFLGNIVEWYEFAVYGYLEPYLQEHFFRGSALGAWMGFAVTFLARPLGGIVLGIAGDTFGRSVAVNVSIVGMLVGTCGQGMLPTYASGNDTLGSIGLALLVALRFLQGLSAAGEISTISTYITEVGPHKSLGRAISLISITCNIGFLSAKATVYATREILGVEAMKAWGWRFPFIAAVLPGLVAIWGRAHLPESEAYLEQKKKIEAPRRQEGGVGNGAEAAASSSEDEEEASDRPTEAASSSMAAAATALQPHGCNIAIGMCGVASAAILQYGGFVWMQSYLAHRGLSPNARMLAGLSGRGLMILLALPVGWLTDVKGVAWVTFAGACLLAAFGLPLFALLDQYPDDPWVAIPVMGVGFGLVGAMALTTFFYYVVELFPTAVRGAAVGISYNMGFSLFGGLAPMAAQASLRLSPLGPGYILSLGGLITASSVLFSLCLRRQGGAKLTHVRHAPYFSSRRLCAGIGDAVPEASGDDSEATSD